MSYPNTTAGCITYPQIQTNYVVIQPTSVFKSTLEGLCSQTLTVIGNFNDLISAGPWTSVGSGLTLSRVPYSANPYYSNLGLYDSEVKNYKGGMGQCVLEYRGLDPKYSSPPSPVYSLDRSTSNEPIQTHPKWISAIGGTPSSPLNGAIYVSYQSNATPAFNPNTSGVADAGFAPNNATFYKWTANVNVSGSVSGFSSFAGVSDYLFAGQTWTATYVSLSAPTSSDLAGVGYIATPTGSPPTPTGYKWIYLGCRYTNQAGVYRIDKSWKMFLDSNVAEIIYT